MTRPAPSRRPTGRPRRHPRHDPRDRRDATARPACPGYANIHVGLGIQREPFDLVPGDAAAAHWRLEVRVLRDAGVVDFRGKFVHGPRGDRFLYLNWGTVDPDGTFTLFRRAKLILSAIPEELVAEALDRGNALVATVNLTDGKGWPLCARVRPPAIGWRVAQL